MRSMFVKNARINADASLMQRPYYISKQWLHKLKYFGEPGPIDNTDFLCKHNFVHPHLWRLVDDLTIACSLDSWNCLVKNFGLKSLSLERAAAESSKSDESSVYSDVCNYLFPCRACQLENELLKQRQSYEKSEFLELKNKWEQLKSAQFQSSHTLGSMATNFRFKPVRIYALSANWFKEWDKFVQLETCPQKHQIPSQINNLTICAQQKSSNEENKATYQLNKSKHSLFSDERVNEIV